MIIVVGNLIVKVAANDYSRFAFYWTKIDKYTRLDIRIRFDTITQHDIIIFQREIFLPFTRLYFQPKPKEADQRAEFLG